MTWMGRASSVSLLLLAVGVGCGGSEDETTGDGDTTSGDGDMSAGDGDMTSGDGDLSAGDGDMTSGDGDLSAGDGDTAAGDGDMTSGDGDGCVVDLDCDPPLLPSTGDFGQDCVDRINQFRVGCHCMEPLERWTEAEACAKENAEQDKVSGQPHGSWRSSACEDETGPLSSQYYGWATNECPGYGSSESVLGLCLSQMYHEGSDWAQQLGRNPEQSDYDSCNGACYQSNGHFIAMTKATHSLVACGITDSGDFWSVQNFQ